MSEKRTSMSERQAKAALATTAGRRLARRLAAALAVAAGVLYVLIALEVVHVADTAGKDSPFVPMMAAAVAFFVGAAVLLLLDRRLAYALGIGVQLVVLAGYVAVAPDRDPHYEVWGITVKVLQVAILGLLLYLAVRGRTLKTGASVAPGLGRVL